MLKMFTCEAIIFLWNENTTAVEPEGPNFALAAMLFGEMDRNTGTKTLKYHFPHFENMKIF
jgi:hypothetical protein